MQPPAQLLDRLQYRVELWDDAEARLLEVLVASADLQAAREAFRSLAERRPQDRLLLRHRIRVVARAGSTKA